MSDQGFLRRFLNSGRSGFYCRVLREGAVEAGQEIMLLESRDNAPTIANIVDRIKKS